MHTRQIYRLLVEATTADAVRFNQIQCELGDALDAHYGDDERGRAVAPILDGLFVRVGTKNPAALPDLLPFFEMVCSDRPRNDSD